jgi:GT2 family glycosyltransferase
MTACTCYLLGFPTLGLPRRNLRFLDRPCLLPTKLIIGGRGVLIPSSVFERLGLFDEARLPHAGSDNDFYLRCAKKGVPLFVAADATVYVDDTRTTLAARAERLNWKEFLETLKDRRSHRNLRDLEMLFRLHYPVKRLHHLGLALNLARFFFLYAWNRMRYLLQAR